MEKQRTSKQNKSLHKLFQIISYDLNEKGLDQRVVMKPSFSLWWTPESVKANLWKPVMEAMYGKEHTADLTTKELNKVFEQLAHIIGEHHGIELEWPSVETTENYLQSLEQHD